MGVNSFSRSFIVNNNPPILLSIDDLIYCVLRYDPLG